MARAHNRKSRLLKTAAEMTKPSRRIIFVGYKRFPMTQPEMSPRNGAQQQLLPTLPPQQHHRYIHTGRPTKPTQNHLKTQKNRNTEFEIGFQIALDLHKALTHSRREKKPRPNNNNALTISGRGKNEPATTAASAEEKEGKGCVCVWSERN